VVQFGVASTSAKVFSTESRTAPAGITARWLRRPSTGTVSRDSEDILTLDTGISYRPINRLERRTLCPTPRRCMCARMYESGRVVSNTFAHIGAAHRAKRSTREAPEGASLLAGQPLSRRRG